MNNNFDKGLGSGISTSSSGKIINAYFNQKFTTTKATNYYLRLMYTL
jgi:hypothetical protein